MSEEEKTEKTDFISGKIEIKGTACTFEIASVKNKWAIRVVDNKEKKILKVVKLNKITSASITDAIHDIIGRKYGKGRIIDELDLGEKMAELLNQIDTYQKTGVAPEIKPTPSEAEEEMISKSTADIKKKERQPDSFWSAYSTAISKPYTPPPIEQESVFNSNGSTQTESTISFETTTPTESQSLTTPQETPTELKDTLSALGVICPLCGAEVGIDDEVCPKCGTRIE